MGSTEPLARLPLRGVLRRSTGGADFPHPGIAVL